MFNNARLKLTAWYLLIIMCISTFFSVLIYRVLTNEFDRFANLQRYRIERGFRDNFLAPQDLRLRMQFVDPELIEETKRRIGIVLVVINSGILILSGGIGYFLAGRTLKPIKNMVEEQNRFISDASHELKTPLTSLKSVMEVYLRDKKPSLREAKKIMEESILEVDKLESLTKSLLLLAKFQRPNGHDKWESISLKETLRVASKKLEPIAQKKNIKINLPSEDVKIRGSLYSLTELFVILLDNAVKYSPEGQKVTLSVQRSDGCAVIAFRDHGIGINKKDLPHIFDRFYRADIARTKYSSGSYGLGLSIAQKIITMHHGSVTVKSVLGKGSTFFVKLPIGNIN